MVETVTLELPEPLARSAHAFAARTNRRVEDVLVEWIDRAAADIPVEALADAEVLALCDLEMQDGQQEELSALLAGQREGVLDSVEHRRLDELMDVYRHGMVRKAKALKVAVDRGLLAPLHDM